MAPVYRWLPGSARVPRAQPVRVWSAEHAARKDDKVGATSLHPEGGTMVDPTADLQQARIDAAQRRFGACWQAAQNDRAGRELGR
jgi:hypothetical protein